MFQTLLMLHRNAVGLDLPACAPLSCAFAGDQAMEAAPGCDGSNGCGAGGAGFYGANVSRLMDERRCKGAQGAESHALLGGAPLRIMKSRLGEGCFDVTLNDGSSGTFVKVPVKCPPAIAPAPVALPPAEACEPPEKAPSKPLLREKLSPGKDAVEAERPSKPAPAKASARVMRAGGRHQLIDIHGLAVFLRQSTRCLSCQAACCLYVTGTISAHLAAVTQVRKGRLFQVCVVSEKLPIGLTTLKKRCLWFRLLIYYF